MRTIEKQAKKEFQKLSKKQQRAINALNRIPTCPGTITHGHSKFSKRDSKWSIKDYSDASTFSY